MAWSRTGSGVAMLFAALAAGCAQGNTSEDFDGAPMFDAVAPTDVTVPRDGGMPTLDGSFPSLDTGTSVDTGADTGPGTDAGADGGVPTDAGADVATPVEAGGDGGCDPTTSHMCSGVCTPNSPNSPDQGCSQSCGQVCQTPANGTPSCTDAGACSFVCNPNFTAMGGTCVSTTSGGCTSDNDCAAAGMANTTCSNGSCTGCEANFGDCDSNPANGCETDLTSTDNCGQCGNSCCAVLCGCLSTAFVGPESCDPGTPFSCGC